MNMGQKANREFDNTKTTGATITSTNKICHRYKRSI